MLTNLRNCPFPKGTHFLHCISFNAARLTKKGACDALALYAAAYNIDVLCITESWAHEGISSAELSLNQRYNVFRRDRVGQLGGGVCILTRKHILCCEPEIHLSGSEMVAVDLVLPSSRCRMICAYFSPTGSSATLLKRMQDMCSDLSVAVEVDYPVILTGDFNQPSIDWK